MNFGEAIQSLNEGKKLAREGWNGKDQFVFMAEIKNFTTADSIMTDSLMYANHLPCFCIKTTSNQIQFGWLATQSDMQAHDWQIVE